MKVAVVLRNSRVGAVPVIVPAVIVVLAPAVVVNYQHLTVGVVVAVKHPAVRNLKHGVAPVVVLRNLKHGVVVAVQALAVVAAVQARTVVAA